MNNLVSFNQIKFIFDRCVEQTSVIIYMKFPCLSVIWFYKRPLETGFTVNSILGNLQNAKTLKTYSFCTYKTILLGTIKSPTSRPVLARS